MHFLPSMSTKFQYKLICLGLYFHFPLSLSPPSLSGSWKCFCWYSSCPKGHLWTDKTGTRGKVSWPVTQCRSQQKWPGDKEMKCAKIATNWNLKESYSWNQHTMKTNVDLLTGQLLKHSQHSLLPRAWQHPALLIRTTATNTHNRNAYTRNVKKTKHTWQPMTSPKQYDRS